MENTETKRMSPTLYSFVMGFALFSCFFGAGNLVFPPKVGLEAGSSWLIGLAGFTTTGIILPVLAAYCTLQTGNDVNEISRSVEKWFAKIFWIISMSTGPFITLPRLSSVSYEVGILPNFPNCPKMPYVIIFFLVSLGFVISRSTVMDKVGKYLAPVLLIALIIIIIKGFISPPGSPGEPTMQNVFPTSCIWGYQTQDVGSGLIFTGTIIMTIVGMGYNREEQRKIANLSVVVTGVGLFIVYGGLCFLGGMSSAAYPHDMDNTALLNAIILDVMGRPGQVVMGFCVFFACLTTAIGSIAAQANYWTDLTKGKVKYTIWCILWTVLAMIIGQLNVQQIIALAYPIIGAQYPVFITWVVLGLFRPLSKKGRKGMWTGASYAAFFVALCLSLSSQFPMFAALGKFYHIFPGADIEFGWVLPAIVCGIIGYFVTRGKTEDPLNGPSEAEISGEWTLYEY